MQQIEADSPEQETSTGESDPLETAKIKAIAGKGKGRGAYKFTARESADQGKVVTLPIHWTLTGTPQAEVERLHDQGR